MMPVPVLLEYLPYRLRDGSIVYVPEGETPKQPE